MARIDDVARVAGVSISTVSYALSGKRPVAPETRRRIEQAIHDVGYRPNAGARMLAGSRTQIFALTEPFRPDTHAPTHMAFVLETSIAARKVGYDLLLLTDAEASAGMQRVASTKLVDAVLALDVAPDDDRVALARNLDIPTVFIGVPDDHDGLTCVDFDFVAAATMAVDRLAELGHVRVGLLGHPLATYEVSNFPPRALEGFRTRADALGLLHFEQRIRTSPTEALRALLEQGVTGIVLQTTQEAHVEVLAELERLSLRVPDDVSLISVGATFDLASFPVRLDAIPLRPRPSCERAVELALDLVGGSPRTAGLHLISPEYTACGSVARPAPAASLA